MVSRYTVVQYVPDPVADERMNIGVIAYDEHGVHSRFLSRWDRVESFGGEDVSFLKDFAAEVARSGSAGQLPLAMGRRTIDASIIEKIVVNWRNSIQLTDPRSATIRAEDLLRSVSDRFLRAPAPRKPRVADRRRAAKLGFEALRKQVPLESIERGERLPGRYTTHEFEIVVRNGSVVEAARALSFEVSEAKVLQDQIDAAAWAIEDLRGVSGEQGELPELSVLAIPPRTSSKTYNSARDLLTTLGAKVVLPDTMESWAVGVAGRLEAHR